MDYKMKADDVLKLINAGYTKADIAAMETSGQDQNQDQNQDQDYKRLESKISETQNQIQQLIKQMQNNNLKTAGINILPDNIETAADKAMSELIRPTIKKEGEK